MAANFQLSLYRKKDSLHLKLAGDFDGNSAHELINALTEYGSDCYQIFIDTEKLKTVYSFGRDVFQKHLSILGKQLNNLFFIGKHRLNIE